jgi:rhodanese-related sulfurtransferase
MTFRDTLLSRPPPVSRLPLRLAEAGGPAAFVLDMRNTSEYIEGHVARSYNIPLNELRFRLYEPPRDIRIYIHCRSGFHSHLALRILKDNGFVYVVNATIAYIPSSPRAASPWNDRDEKGKGMAGSS